MNFTVHTNQGNYTVNATSPGDARAIVRKNCPHCIIQKVKATEADKAKAKAAKVS
jgi:hypothetical protein